MAKENDAVTEYIRNTKAFRKEDRVTEIIEERGTAEGLVPIFSTLEISDAYKPWYDQDEKQCYVLKDQTKCLH
jgi:hypothetical protein